MLGGGITLLSVLPLRLHLSLQSPPCSPPPTPQLPGQDWDLKQQPRRCQSQTLEVPLGEEGCREGCRGLQPGDPALLCQSTLGALALASSKPP